VRPRGESVLDSLALFTIPVALFYPAMYFADFGPCGPTSGWSLTTLAISAALTGLYSFRLLRSTHTTGQVDALSVVRFPLWVCSLLFLLVSGAILLVSLPALVFDFLTHAWWFLLFSVLFFLGALIRRQLHRAR